MVPRSFLQAWECYQLMDLYHVPLGELPSAEKAPCLRLFPDGSLLSRTGPHRGIKADSHPSNWDNSEGTSQLQISQKNGTKVFVVIASKVCSAYFTSGPTGLSPEHSPVNFLGTNFHLTVYFPGNPAVIMTKTVCTGDPYYFLVPLFRIQLLLNSCP